MSFYPPELLAQLPPDIRAKLGGIAAPPVSSSFQGEGNAGRLQDMLRDAQSRIQQKDMELKALGPQQAGDVVRTMQFALQTTNAIASFIKGNLSGQIDDTFGLRQATTQSAVAFESVADKSSAGASSISRLLSEVDYILDSQT